MKERIKLICICGIHIEDIVEYTNEYALEDYKGSFQYVMYLDILELTYNRMMLFFITYIGKNPRQMFQSY